MVNMELHFKGDLRGLVANTDRFGPGRDGKWFEPTMAGYDEDTDITTVYLQEL